MVTGVFAQRMLAIRNFFLAYSGVATLKAQKDILYHQILRDSLISKDIKKPFYPVSDGANPSLLYLIARIMEEQEVSSVLELGGGQTTILLNELARISELKVATLEHDKNWYEYLAEKTDQDIYHAPLVEREVLGVKSQVYGGDFPGSNKFDMLIVDGPIGVRKCSRLGAMEFVGKNLNDEFIILFDDAERKGEKETIELVSRELERKGIVFESGSISGVKEQAILCTGKFRGALYY